MNIMINWTLKTYHKETKRKKHLCRYCYILCCIIIFVCIINAPSSSSRERCKENILEVFGSFSVGGILAAGNLRSVQSSEAKPSRSADPETGAHLRLRHLMSIFHTLENDWTEHPKTTSSLGLCPSASIRVVNIWEHLPTAESFITFGDGTLFSTQVFAFAVLDSHPEFGSCHRSGKRILICFC